MKTYTGSCQCGALQFTIKADITNIIECNCSHCFKKGLKLIFVPQDNFTLNQGENSLSEYRFNTKKIQHLFCTTCGIQAFGFGQDNEGNRTVAVNVRCLDDVDLDSFSVTKVNGKDF